MVCHRDYTEWLLAILRHQIQLETTVEIDPCILRSFHWRIFSALPETGINAPTTSFARHAVLYPLFFGDSKKDATTNTSHIKRWIELLKGGKYLWHN